MSLLAEKYYGLCGFFEGNDVNGYKYVIGSRTMDASVEGRKFNAALNGRGGGSKEMFQGSVQTTRASIENYFSQLGPNL